MRPWPEPGARKEEEAMKKLFALLMALTMTVQLVTPAWADAVEEGPEESTETMEVVQETTEATEETEVPEETEETEATEKVTEPGETTEETEEALPEAGGVEDVAALEAGVVASGTCGENLSWILTEDGVLRISGNGAMPDYSTSSVAPWYSKRTKITSVVVEPGVTNVGDYAFYACLKLVEVELAEEITDIGQGAFRDCTELKVVEIPEGVKSIGSSAFSDCSSLTSVSIPDGVTSIGGSVFSGCSGLTSVSIPVGVTSIGMYAFSGCSNLISVGIPDSVTSIGMYAFSGCSGLTSVSIPEGVASIEFSVFYGCSSLTSVNIPDGVTSIGGSAFDGCSGLTSMSVPKGVTSIGMSAFEGCSNLTNVNIPEGVTSIEDRVFLGCSSLTNVSILEGVKSIGGSAFRGCSSLTSVSIPNSITSIGEYAFSGCTSLKNVYYGGNEIAWKQIQISSNNSALSNAEIHYGIAHICKLNLIPEKAPTCTEKGNHEYYYCPICKKASKDAEGTQLTTVEAETLPALGHSMEKHEETAATCTTLGNHTYYFCTTCKKAFLDAAGKRETTVKEQTVDALGHAMVLHDTQAAACGKPGNAKYYTCRICGNSYKDYQGIQATTPEAETIPALDHLMVKTEAVAPTHTSGGNRAYYTWHPLRQTLSGPQWHPGDHPGGGNPPPAPRHRLRNLRGPAMAPQ